MKYISYLPDTEAVSCLFLSQEKLFSSLISW